MKTKRVRAKKPVKLRFFLYDSNETFSYWTEEQLRAIKFRDLLDLALENKIELLDIIFNDAITGKDFTIGKIKVSQELETSLNNLYTIFPTVKYFVQERQKLMNRNFIKA